MASLTRLALSRHRDCSKLQWSKQNETDFYFHCNNRIKENTVAFLFRKKNNLTHVLPIFITIAP